jgi:sugar-specific transcriptional regulator TrmB
MGLTQTEIVLYITGLQTGPVTVAELAKQTGIKRTTAHSALSSLEQKGLAGTHTQTGATTYVMKDPNLIEQGITEKIETLKNRRLDFINLLPLLTDLSTRGSGATEVSTYNGFKGVKTVVDTALYCASKRWKIISPERNFFSDSGREYGDYFIRVRKQRGIKAKSLWESSFVHKRTFDQTAFEFRDPRILPKSVEGKFKTTIIMFDNSVAFINSAGEQTAVLIKSPEIAATMEIFFDSLWESAKPIPKRLIRE